MRRTLPSHIAVESMTGENEQSQVEDCCAAELERQKICGSRRMNFSMPEGRQQAEEGLPQDLLVQPPQFE